jgi:hypothetical protein
MRLTPIEKAKHITESFKRSKPSSGGYMMISTEHAKQCALICVNELLENLSTLKDSKENVDLHNYYQDVETEIYNI